MGVALLGERPLEKAPGLRVLLTLGQARDNVLAQDPGRVAVESEKRPIGILPASARPSSGTHSAGRKHRPPGEMGRQGLKM
eukprot:1142747-Alexandrium_andersonii.AAC.1